MINSQKHNICCLIKYIFMYDVPTWFNSYIVYCAMYNIKYTIMYILGKSSKG